MELTTGSFLVVLQLLILSVNYGDFMECNDGCNDASLSNMINVHLVPYSHDDIGQMKTFIQNYHGDMNKFQQTNVKSKLHVVIKELLRDPKRKFTYGQVAYFLKWFKQQDSHMQDEVKGLIRNGQLHIVGGGWVMNDEATAHYQSLIDQFSLGLRYLTEELSNCSRPHVGWQIDSYGHSREMASLLAQMGYSAQFINRVTKSVKDQHLSEQTAEMIWRGSEVLEDEANIFTVLLKTVTFPDGFCFDSSCTDSPIIDDDAQLNNVKEKVDNFISYIKVLSKNYRTNELIVPMGKEFSYKNAYTIYTNMDKLIHRVNNISNEVNVFYSNPSCYIKAIERITPQPQWPQKTGDFLPYNTWSGYFTSRPSLKLLEKYGNRYMQVAKQLLTLSQLQTKHNMTHLHEIQHEMALLQNHNGISGTARQHVVNDYVKRLSSTIKDTDAITEAAIQRLTKSKDNEFLSCHQLNISVCEFCVENSHNLEIVLFNPLSRTVVQPVRIPYPNGSYYVWDSNGSVVRSQLRPLPNRLVNLRNIRDNITQHELVFLAKVNKLSQYRVSSKDIFDYIEGEKMDGPFTIKNDDITLHFDKNGFLSKVEMNNVTENVHQSFYYYKSAKEDIYPPYTKSSGITSFVPDNAEPIEIAEKVSVKIYDGPVVKEIHQEFNEWTSQVIRLYNGIKRVEFEWLIGPIPVIDGEGMEIITRFKTNISSNGVFYTDANGREMIQRKRYGTDKDLAQNYYPVTSRIAIQDNTKRLALLNDRPQGGSSVQDGMLELMLHRRILMDDGSGTNEYLNEMEYSSGLVVRGKTYLILNEKDAIEAEIKAQQEMHLPLWPFFSQFREYKQFNDIPSFSYLPDSISVLTLEPYNQDEYLLRLENTGNLRKFDLKPLLNSLRANHIREMSLDGNMAKADIKRPRFHGLKNQEVHKSERAPLDLDIKEAGPSIDFEMKSMEIVTLLITSQE